MHDLVPITPLGAARARTETHGPVTLTEVTDRALASVAARPGREAETVDLLARWIGAAPPGPGRLAGARVMAFWMGPDQWMIDAPFDTDDDLARQIATDAGGIASITEQTDAWCRFDLSGEGLAAVFERLAPVDLRRFTGGEAQRTALDHMGCFLLCHDPRHVSVLGPRSSAGSLHHALQIAMRSAH